MRTSRWTKLVAGWAIAGLLAAGAVGVTTAVSAADQPRSEVPKGFEPEASSWTSARSGHVLGWAPCDGNSFCPSLISTDDGGQSWSEDAVPDIQPAGVTSGQLSVFFAEADNGSTGLVRGRSGTFSTFDGGRTWTKEDLGDDDGLPLDFVTASNTQLYVMFYGSDGDTQVVRTPIGGRQWELVPELSGSDRYGSSIAARGDRVIASEVVDYDSTKVWIGDDSDWTARKHPCRNESGNPRVAVDEPGRLYVMCDPDSISEDPLFVSDDGGTTFDEAGRNDLAVGNNSDLAAYGDTIVVGEYGGGCAVDISFDRGRTWKRIRHEGGQGIVRDLRFTDAQTATLVCGDDAASGRDVGVFRTTDGGHTWQPVNFD